jgi:hypothetical protein
MGAGSACHCIGKAVAVFVADGVVAIELEVFFGAEVVGGCDHDVLVIFGKVIYFGQG